MGFKTQLALAWLKSKVIGTKKKVDMYAEGNSPMRLSEHVFVLGTTTGLPIFGVAKLFGRIEKCLDKIVK
jgi:hypothetical protein